MQLPEYTSRQLLRRVGVDISLGQLAWTADQAGDIAEQIGTFPVAIKAQLPLGGRGKAGAIRQAHNPAEAKAAFRGVTSVEMSGLNAKSALIEPWKDVSEEIYLAVTTSPDFGSPIILLSAEGGIEIEEQQGRLEEIQLTADGRVPDASFRTVAYRASISPKAGEKLLAVARGCARAFYNYDATLVELNPIGISGDALKVLDATIIVDDSALFRQPELVELANDVSPILLEDAVRHRDRLEYVRLAGEVGLISGGAGMTMAAMDIIGALGGRPACFLDCSANPTLEGYSAAFRILDDDVQVRAILISIFGGGTQMDRVAQTLVEVLSLVNCKKPIVIRLEGTNADLATEILEAAGLTNIRDIEVAASHAIKAANR